MKNDPMHYGGQFFHFLNWVISEYGIYTVSLHGVCFPLSFHHLVGSSVGSKASPGKRATGHPHLLDFPAAQVTPRLHDSSGWREIVSKRRLRPHFHGRRICVSKTIASKKMRLKPSGQCWNYQAMIEPQKRKE
jgi:hypothetical protein